METTKQLQLTERKNSASNPVWMDAVRIVLGLFLFVKGFSFLSNSSDVFYLLSQQEGIGPFKQAPTFFSIVHIVGGLMIAFGALTRLALLCQIPILMMAVFVVNPQYGITLENRELWVSILVLGLLLFFMVMGPGRYSVDNKVFRNQSKPMGVAD